MNDATVANSIFEPIPYISKHDVTLKESGIRGFSHIKRRQGRVWRWCHSLSSGLGIMATIGGASKGRSWYRFLWQVGMRCLSHGAVHFWRVHEQGTDGGQRQGR